MRLDSALKKSRPQFISAQKISTLLMHWMSVKLPDNFQMREHSWRCRFHIKQYFSWTMMKPISPTQRCVSGNVYKQTSPEITEVTSTRRTIMGFLHETSLIWVIIMGVKLWLVYFRSLHICKNYHSYAKYMINSYTSYNIVIVKITLWLFIMLSVNFFCNTSSYDILAYITKN